MELDENTLAQYSVQFFQDKLPQCKNGFDVYKVCRDYLFYFALKLGEKDLTDEQKKTLCDKTCNVYESWSEVAALFDSLMSVGAITKPYVDNFKMVNEALSKNFFAPDAFWEQVQNIDAYVVPRQTHKYVYYKPLIAAYLVLLAHDKGGCDIGKTTDYLSGVLGVSVSSIEARYLKLKNIDTGFINQNILYLLVFMSIAMHDELDMQGKMPKSLRKAPYFIEARSKFQSFFNRFCLDNVKGIAENEPETIEAWRMFMEPEFHQEITVGNTGYNFALKDMGGIAMMLFSNSVLPHIQGSLKLS